MAQGLTEAQLEALEEAARPLFAEAVAQGMHTPFSLDCDYWGREYADKLVEALTAPTAASS